MNKSLVAPLMSTTQIEDIKARAMADAKEIMVDLKSGGALFAIAHSKMVLRLLKEGSAWRKEAFAQIEERLAALEKGPANLADCYRGVFSGGERYKRGDLATAAGSLWLCLHETTDRPGKCADWRLVSKGIK